MKIIKQSVNIIPQTNDLIGVLKQIELAGRISYKSESRITDTSYAQFVSDRIRDGHLAILEHGTVYLTICRLLPNTSKLIKKYKYNPYSRVKYKGVYAYITTNYRVIYENKWEHDLIYMTNSNEYHEKRISAHFICSRSTSHQIVRHRVFSFVQESQRFINYSRGQFEHQITFIDPEIEDKDICNTLYANYQNAEYDYFNLINLHCRPETARFVLPNATKTEIFMTGFESDWKHFFELRCSNHAQSDIRQLANNLRQDIINYLGYEI